MLQAFTRHRTLVFLALLAHAVIFYGRVRTSWFFADDFLNIQLAREGGFSLKYLFRDVFGQVAPGYRLTQLLFDMTFGPSFKWAMIIVGALSVSCTYALIVISERFGARPWAIAAGVLLFIGLPQFSQVQQWWAAAVHTIFSFTLLMWALTASVSRLRWRVVWMTVCYAGALTFTAKSVCFPVIAAAVIYFREHQNNASTRDAMKTMARELIPLVILTILYLILVKLVGPTSYPTKPSLPELWHYTTVMLVESLFGGMFGLGGSFGAVGPAAIPTVGILAVGALAIMKKPALAVIWLGVGAYIIAAAVLIALNRAVLLPDSAHSLRYAAESAGFLCIALILSLSALGSSRIIGMCAAAIVLLGQVNIELKRSHITPYPWTDQVKSYVHNLKRSAHDLAGKENVVVLDAPVPDTVEPHWMGGYATTRNFLPIYVSIPVAEADKATYTVTDDGHIVPMPSPTR